MTPTNLILWAFGALGHVIFWVAVVNRLHAFAIYRKLMDFLTLLCGLAVSLIPLAVAWSIWRGDAVSRGVAWMYVIVSAFVGIVGLGHRLYVFLHRERQGVVVANHTSHHRPGERREASFMAPGIPTWLSRLPGNEVLRITVQEKQLVIPRLTAAHDGLRIVHLSDLHMSGRITKPYFESVVEHVNLTAPDVVAITGDIVERTPCIEWIPDTLGRLCAPGGVYYVLGNHDKKVDVGRLNGALSDAGIIHVGGRCVEVSVRGTQLQIGGNELPWFGPAVDFPASASAKAPGGPLRILLAHSPDQFGWAQAQDVDLLLAGHNHGGQVCLPVLGAILSPSRHGVRYSAGTFRSGITVLHVSRGTASLTPVRWNCPPEIAVLVLRAAQ